MFYKWVPVLSDALILIEAVECIRTVLNKKIGLSLPVHNADYSRRPVKGVFSEVCFIIVSVNGLKAHRI